MDLAAEAEECMAFEEIWEEVMFITERDAKVLWCPMVRPNNDDRLREGTCIASGCMMWRERDPNQYGTGSDGLPIALEDRGYCGLAGVPK